MRANTHPCFLLWLLAPLALTAIGCADDATCDRDQELVNGVCQPMSDDQGSGGSDGSGGSGASAGNGGGSNSAGAAGATSCEIDFGDACEDDTDCGCAAPVCATLPGNFLCTNTCDDDPGICPEGFECQDLSAFGDYPSTCFPEGALSF